LVFQKNPSCPEGDWGFLVIGLGFFGCWLPLLF